MTQKHPIPPLYDAASQVLVLGSFPSVKSREGMFFYHHPQNRFWRVIAGVYGSPVPETIDQKRALLLETESPFGTSLPAVKLKAPATHPFAPLFRPT